MQPVDPDDKSAIHDLELFSRTLAELVVLALTAYVESLQTLHDVIEGELTEQRLEVLHTAGRNLGVELLAFTQVIKYASNSQNFPADTHSPIPILPLAAELGASYSMLLRVKDQRSAAETPVSPIPVVRDLYDQPAKDWLARYVSLLPEFVEK